ncbi:HNH endonuclease signature motif containing protein [Mycobacterium sp. ZZG]
MFEELAAEALRSRGAAAIGAWARAENAAVARRLSAMADVLESKLADKGSAEREQWCLDNWDAVSAEVAAAQNVSPGVASNELLDAWSLRQRMPRVAEVFATGAISYRLARAAVRRTRLIADPDARAKVDVEIAAQITAWGSLSKAKQESEIDYWVDRFDPAAVVRAEGSSRSCHVDATPAENGSGVCYVEAVLHEHDGEALDRRLDELAGSVCNRDPRNRDQRRAAAIGAMSAKADRLTCLCGTDDCPAAGRAPSAVVVLVIAEEESLSDDTPFTAHGEHVPEPEQRTGRDLLASPEGWGPAKTNPGMTLGGAVLPAPLLAAVVAKTATIRRLIHPGQSPPESRYVPSAKLADFVRCRDLTCRFPGCDVPADRCDLDHTIPYPVGPTQASNLKALCRKHHLLETFWGWRDVQSPDGTVVWTSPGGQVVTTRPGSRVLFPALCRPTAPVAVAASDRVPTPGRLSGLGMPRRTQARVQARAQRLAEQRRENEALLEPRNGGPPC